ncbi:MAG: hypothetical protein JJT93_03665 [Gammaproteobacteria bacterium]|nr:hypothetical protein [Gammaproteobacteria bacterium]
MTLRLHLPLTLLALLLAVPAAAERTPEEIIEFAAKTAGGDAWRYAQTNVMRGHATLCRDGRPEACVHADDYVMYRLYPTDITDVHAGTGKFRLDAFVEGEVLFQNSYDGEHSWTHRGRVPEAEAQEAQQSNFGFSAIRFAGREGFPVERLVDDTIEGLACYTVRVGDPSGGSTLFWIEQATGLIRAVAWPTPRGFHQRVYTEFYWIDDPGFMQPGRVRLYYDGIKVNDIYWTEASINVPLADALFVLGD